MKIVIKIGSAVLVKKEGGVIDRRTIASIVEQVNELISRGHSVALVSSGAVASCPTTTFSKSLRAAIGQPKLMQLYGSYCNKFGREVCQLLYTHEDLSGERSTYTKKVLLEAMKNGIIPVINANDSVSGEELDAIKEYADNDILAARVATMIAADQLYLLIREKGLINYDTGEVIHAVDDIQKASQLVRGKSAVGSGGMQSKLTVADMVCKKGVGVWLVPGKKRNAIIDAIDGKEIGTTFKVKRKRQ
ncbi:MAG: hypothetical protein ACD_81C00179G0001 [uncultured bacterium]|uniref:Gamma-glutamyl kinase n=2 Tax=Candidatus Wolfeibacteriota TaxID=1752735 RepID=A0A0G1K7P6_9BACT|nr:MAG: hypothetical protein ACD_81C00179G0001 [uncultured bacterium]KKR12967.1 MAG: gamma-glutamyl kinase [Candidatus Wolfebacteria bacterium GW2011_GWC2_39_22]KKT43894.1 MAG: gamma-glutamyl kinase [Candidatus Wolfebacteria bacterium GW2011_GWE2_44_13]HBI25379.1 glutamate 5-kinase [Candidatus Wolfebacteria bacterium]